MATIVDSSIVIASIHVGDTQHAKAVSALREAEKPLIVHEHVAVETTAVLARLAGKSVAETFLQAVLSFKDFAFMPSAEGLFADAAREFAASRGKLSLVDCMLLCLSRHYPVLTFDEALQKAIKRQK